MRVLEEFKKNRFCKHHNGIAEHDVQKTDRLDDEADRDLVAYYSKCSVCNHVEKFEYSEEK